jgi:hypothetical protein
MMRAGMEVYGSEPLNPTDAPLLLRDIESDDIYALTLRKARRDQGQRAEKAREDRTS